MATSKKREILARSDLDPSDTRAAWVTALDMLARRDRAAGDLQQKLLDKGFEPFVVSDVIEQLLRKKLLDDRRYVENYLSFHAERGQGPMRVRQDLKRMGVPEEFIQLAVNAYPNWLVHLKKARQKKFGGEVPTDYADRQRQARFLGYRGYTGSQIRLALGADIDLDTDLMDS